MTSSKGSWALGRELGEREERNKKKKEGGAEVGGRKEEDEPWRNRLDEKSVAAHWSLQN